MTEPRDGRAQQSTSLAAATTSGSRPLGAIADLAELLGGETQRSRKFLGGLVVGGLIGAAIAGTSIRRLRAPAGDDGQGP